MFPLPLGRGRVRVGVAPLATSAVYHRRGAPFPNLPPSGGEGTRGFVKGVPRHPGPRGFDVSPPPRKGEGQGGGRSSCDQRRLPPAGRPLPNLPPSGGEGTRGFGKGSHVTATPRGFDVSPPPRKGEGQGGGRSSCDQRRLPPAGRPLPNLPPSGGKGHGVS